MYKKIIKINIYAILAISSINLSHADSVNTSFTLNASVQGGINIYCNGTPASGLCGTINFPQFSGSQLQQNIVATITSNDPIIKPTLTVTDSAGGNYALKLASNPTQQIPLAVQYTDCTGNNYGSITSNSVAISGAQIIGSSISGATPQCTAYNTPNPQSGTYGKFTFTLLPMATLPQDGNYTETLNLTVSST